MDNLNLDRLKAIALQFISDGKITAIKQFGSGHINDTYRISVQSTTHRSYLLQRINHHIFTDIDGLMNNIHRVTEHLKKVIAPFVEDVEKHTLTIIPTKDHKLYYSTPEGDYWRVFILLEDTKSYDKVSTQKQAYSAGAAFGQFQKQLASLDASSLVDILPNFHNIDFRMSNLRMAIESDRFQRVAEVNDLLAYIFAREHKMRRIIHLAQNGDLPLRIIHNDTKFNNVLLDQDDNVQCVIDLDTTMPGYVAYDFGDAIRSIINTAAEDESDTSKVTLDIALFEAYTTGYLREAKDFLTAYEIESLLYGVFLLPYMQAVRFLTDYLEGDIYYKIHSPLHNLVRTRSQLKLVDELEANESKLAEILHSSLVNS